MNKHYYVSTPRVDCYYYAEPPESFSICECVEAKNKSDAKLAFVKKQRAAWKPFSMDCYNWFYHLGRDENPFKELTVEEAMCKHGVCNCDFYFKDKCTYGNPRDPKWDYCWDCIKEDYDEEIKKAIAEANTLASFAEKWVGV